MDNRKTDTAPPRRIYLKDYTPPAWLVDTVRLEFELEPADTRVVSKLHLRRNPDSAARDADIILDGQHLQLESVERDGVALGADDYVLDEEQLRIPCAADACVLTIVNRIVPASNTALEGLYQSGGMLCTQCEAEGFRRITFFPDRPDVMARYQVRLVADKQRYPVLLSNGNRVAAGELEDGRHFAEWHDPFPKPSYLFALVAGDLVRRQDHFTTMGGREVELNIYVEAENRHKCDHAMACLKQAMRWDEKAYGREYDLDIFNIVAVNDFNMGAMENKSLNIFNASCVLASPETATDDDFYNIQSIIGHEYFHNWSGNRVTCRDWFQLSLKEGFTVFRDQEFSADLNSRAVKRIDDVNVLRIHQFAQDAGPMAHPVRPAEYMEISNFYTVTVYNKGAEVVRMLRELVGPAGFRRGTDLYFNRHDGQAVTTDDFVAAMEDANDIDLQQFRRWYDQAGTPVLEVDDDYDAEAKTYTLKLRQHTPSTPGQEHKQPFHIPLAVGLLDAAGRDLPLQLEGEEGADAPRTRVLGVTGAEQAFTFTGIAERPVPSLLRGFSAPVKIARDWSEEELLFLFAHDSDEFNRWDAGQTLMLRELRRLVAAVQQEADMQMSPPLVEAVRATLTDTRLDPALVAQAISVPGESYLGDQYDEIDVMAVHRARTFMVQSLACQLGDDFQRVYARHHAPGPYVFDSEAMAARALKNRCLRYLVESGDADAVKLAVTQFDAADNMTDAMGALQALSDVEDAARDELLARFHQRWRHDAQVLEKWFALQAVSQRADTPRRVRELLGHADFSYTNPNRVRSLIGRFCLANPLHFHAADGSGYVFLTEQVLKLDALNPQIAARLVQGFLKWRHYDSARRALMQRALETLRDHAGLSRDVSEIVTRALEDGGE